MNPELNINFTLHRVLEVLEKLADSLSTPFQNMYVVWSKKNNLTASNKVARYSTVSLL